MTSADRRRRRGGSVRTMSRRCRSRRSPPRRWRKRPYSCRVQQRRRIAAYGVCLDADGRVLLVRLSAESLNEGCWMLPGGGIEHGEHPADAVVREIAEETGLRVEVIRVRDIHTDVITDRRGARLHHDRLVFDVRLIGGE